jgi:hypothetical protein
MPRGGYRKPNNPAPVSGPGALSRRTDGGPVQAAKEMSSGGKYGERKALQELQQSAPMQGNTIPSAPASSIAVPRTPVTNLFAPTERPDEPITAGAPVGAGRTPQNALPERFAMLNKYMPALEQLESNPDAPETFKIFMKTVRTIANEG